MNITLLTGSISDGGAERVLCNLANYLKEKGHSVEILIYSETNEGYYVRPDIKVLPLIRNGEKKNKLYNIVLCYFRLVKYLRLHKDIDRYVALLPRPMIMILSLSWLTKGKIIVSERNDPLSYPSFWKKLLKHFVKRADGVVFQTKDAMDLCRDYIRNCRSAVIPNAINPEFIKKPFDGDKLKRIVAVGRMTHQKNFELLITAFSKIADSFPDYNLTIFGKGPKQPELEKLSESLGIGSRVLFPGYVDNIQEELEKSTLYVLSSNYEGMPNSLMESMSLGLPCISTDCPCGGPRYLIQQGVNGVLVPVGDADRLARAMAEILSNKDKRDEMARRAIDIRKQLSTESIYQKWEDFIINE